MCGLVGIMSSDVQMRHKDALHDLLILDTFRGRDSTGVAAIRRNFDTHTLKATVNGYEFTDGPRLGEHLKYDDVCWIGHNRFGTVGKTTKANAHPFEVLDGDGNCVLVGAHNGTLKNKHVLANHANFGTDSEAFYNEIANTSVEEAVAKVEGAWALTYFDHVNNQFRILRNKERPLFYAFSEDSKTLIWASEAWMIRIACQRRDIKLWEDKVTFVNEDTLYCFSVPTKRGEAIDILDRKGGVVGKQAPAFFQQAATTGGSHKETTPAAQTAAAGPLTGNYSRSGAVVWQGQRQQGQVWNFKTGKWEEKPTTKTSTSQCGTAQQGSGEKQPLKSESGSTNLPSVVTPSNVVPLTAGKKYKGYAGEPLSLSELRDDLDNGCAWCEDQLIAVTDRFAWLDKGKPVCAKCLDGSHTDEVDEAMELLVTAITNMSIH